jgi:hypothetical protein
VFARLESLIVEYVRGVEGSYDVLRDAFLERGLEPLPADETATARLDSVFARLPKIDQVRVASASVRRLAPEIRDARVHAQVVAALDAVDAGPAPEGVRNGLFRTWQSAERNDGKRVVWAAWMLLRDLPATSLHVTRALRAGELEVQIAAVAAALAVA